MLINTFVDILMLLLAVILVECIFHAMNQLVLKTNRIIIFGLLGSLFISFFFVFFSQNIICFGICIFLILIFFLLIYDTCYFIDAIYFSSMFVTLMFYVYLLIRLISNNNNTLLNSNTFSDYSRAIYITIIILGIVIYVFGIKFSLPKNKISIFIIFSSVSVLIMELLFFNQIQTISMNNLSEIVFFLFLGLVFFSNNIIIQYLYNDFHQLTIISKNNFLSKITDSYIQGIHNEQEKVFKIRHDIKNNLIILQQLINNNQIAEANQVIDEINSHLKYKKSEVYTGNIFIDAYLSNIINNSQIDIQIKCNDLKDLHYKPDILAIIINLVDNAVENAKSLVAIQIKHEKSNSILIKVSNDCEHDPSKHLKKSKKQGDHGYGLRIVRETINQYQGTYLTSYQNGIFTTYVMLNLEGNDEK